MERNPNRYTSNELDYGLYQSDSHLLIKQKLDSLRGAFGASRC